MEPLTEELIEKMIEDVEEVVETYFQRIEPKDHNDLHQALVKCIVMRHL